MNAASWSKDGFSEEFSVNSNLLDKAFCYSVDSTIIAGEEGVRFWRAFGVLGCVLTVFPSCIELVKKQKKSDTVTGYSLSEGSQKRKSGNRANRSSILLFDISVKQESQRNGILKKYAKNQANSGYFWYQCSSPGNRWRKSFLYCSDSGG